MSDASTATRESQAQATNSSDCARRILIARSDGQHPLRYVLPFGIRLPLTKGAAGKVLLFGLDAAELDAVVAASITLGHEPAGTTGADVAARFGDVASGYARSADERETGVVSVAVSVPRRSGDRNESLSLTSPAERSELADLEAHVPELKRAAVLLGDRLDARLF